VAEEKACKVACGVVVTFVLDRIKCGMVEPPCCTAVIGESQDVRVAACVVVFSDREMDGNDGR
jgi:hypothetical protein